MMTIRDLLTDRTSAIIVPGSYGTSEITAGMLYSATENLVGSSLIRRFHNPQQLRTTAADLQSS